MSNLKKNVEQISAARGLSQESLSGRLGMSPEQLSDFLISPPKRKETIVHRLSKELLVPEVLLFADGIKVQDTRIPDFRLSTPSPGGYSRETLRWIDFAETISTTAAEVGNASRAQSLSSLISARTPIPRAAKQLRDAIGFTEELQLSIENARVMFAALRQRIETLNLFVLQLSFPEADGTGFCISGTPYDVVVINTKYQIPARRSFTLAHEIYHCALGESGISDHRIAKNDIETRCNSFAAHFLAPDSLVRKSAESIITENSLAIDELRKLSNTLNISMHASLLRLIELEIYKPSAASAWKKFIQSQGDPDAPKGGGGKRTDEWKYKLSRYGFKFASVFGAAKDRGEFDDLEFYRFSGIKPKYQASYIKHGSRGKFEDAIIDERADDA